MLFSILIVDVAERKTPFVLMCYVQKLLVQKGTDRRLLNDENEKEV